MANVRETNGTTDKLFLGGGGVSLAGWGLIWIGRLVNNTSLQPMMAAVDTPSTSLGVLYYNGPATPDELSFGSPAGDRFTTTPGTLNTTDVYAIGLTKAAGTTVVRAHVRNLTTGAAAVHADMAGTIADQAGTWDQTEIGTGDGGTFLGNRRHAVAAMFTAPYSDADFNTILTSTQQVYALNPARLWDLNQAAVGTAVANLMTGSADEVSRTGTTVVNDAAFDFWTFGVGGPPQIARPDADLDLAGWTGAYNAATTTATLA